MQFNIATILAIAAFGANTAMGAAFPAAEAAPAPIIETPGHLLGRAILTATNAYAACNCPNNCSHKAGSSCKYYGGVSDNSDVVNGHCTSVGGSLTCM